MKKAGIIMNLYVHVAGDEKAEEVQNIEKCVKHLKLVRLLVLDEIYELRKVSVLRRFQGGINKDETRNRGASQRGKKYPF